MKLEFSRQIFPKYSNIKFHETPSSETRVAPYGQNDMTKLIVALRNFAEALNKNEAKSAQSSNKLDLKGHKFNSHADILKITFYRMLN